jgi:hypothetical protein
MLCRSCEPLVRSPFTGKMFDIHVVITVLVALVQFKGNAILLTGKTLILFLAIEYTLENPS